MTQRIAITMGDPAGVGPEVIASAMASGDLYSGHSDLVAIILGHHQIMQRAFQLVGSQRQVIRLDNIEQFLELPLPRQRDSIYCLNCVSDDSTHVLPGVVDGRGGQAAFEAVRTAAELALSGQIDAMVTAPLNKQALHLAGHHWPGHTEMLAELCGVSSVAMMLYLPPFDIADPTVATLPPRLRLGPLGLGIGHVTLHVGMRDALEQIQTARVLETCQLVHRVMEGFALALGHDNSVRLGVAALNPHAGENGLFGREELEIINPAVHQARAAGILASDALPCDTLMVRAAAGEFDGLVAMYHDQGHITLKLLGMQRAVNIALGLPIIRTSVAHGTAFDRAWQGTADHQSLLHAVRVASQLAPVGRSLFDQSQVLREVKL
ncbi:MAG: 4-hydroxythreonine-4-phosphate dehydrogenase PdxA [Planctomycetaceae bacterium]|nr:4-hydroxythreonine-4-phosphate dehydrogenase PdxA [Planctomycetaceae bacterium]